jgi:two-component system sensor histidine kinase YesM
VKSFLSFPKRLLDVCKRTFAGTISLMINTKIQLRLTVLFIVLSVIPLAITGFFSYKESVDAIVGKTGTYSAQVMDQIAVNIKTELDRLENDSVDIALSELTQDVLVNIESMSEWEIYNIESSLREALVKKFSILHDVSDVLLFTASGRRIIAYGDRSFKLNFRKDFLDTYLEELAYKKGTPVWKGANPDKEGILVQFATSPEQMNKSDCILLGRAILSLDTREVIGTLIIRTNEKYFSNIYRDTYMGSDADIFVMDSEGNVVSSRNPRIPVAEKYRDPRLIRELLNRDESDSKTFSFIMDERSYLIAYSAIKSVGWYVVSTIPYSYIDSEAREIRSTILLLSLACSVLAVFLSYIFTLSISRPLKRLVSAMNEVKKGNLSIGMPDKRNDEIGEVTDNFNKMLNEIKKLMEDVKNQEIQKRKAEIETLQAQINPHFLSNTLNTVKWLASAQKADNIEAIVSSLIQLLSVSMGKGEEFITIRQEIEYIKSYITIQEYRYYDKFKVVFDIEEDIFDCRILKFLIQPLVENSIIHGTKSKMEQELIVIKGFRYDNVLKITVTDNGVGIPAEKLSRLITSGQEDRKHSFSGIGINNVNDRIRMYFGPSYGLQIESVPNLYTTVELTVPIICGEGLVR